MGVKGLWQLLDSEGVLDNCEVEISSLKGKILAVDVSIWLYHFVKSVPTDKDSALSPLVIGGLFQRVCKLLHFGIKPIFVFDGSAPVLKKETIAARQELKRKGDMDYTKLAKKILKNKLKLMAIEEISTSNAAMNVERSSEKKKIEKAPPIDFLTFLESPEGSEEDEDDDYNMNLVEEDYDIDTSSIEFKKLPYDIQEQILLVSRKRTIDSTQIPSDASSTSPISHETSPKKGDSALEFSKAQVEALIKRRKLMDELEALRGNSIKKSDESKVINHGKIASSSEKKYIFTKNTQAGWSLSLTDSKSDESQKDEISSFAKPITDEKSISDIEDDNEFMNLMFGDAKEVEDVSHPVNNIPVVQKEQNLPIQVSSSQSDESGSEFEIDIPTNASVITKQHKDIQATFEKEEFLCIESSHKLIAVDTIKLPEIILDGLIKSDTCDKVIEKPSAISGPIISKDIIYSSSSSEDEIDPEYKAFIEEVSSKVPSSKQQTDFKDLVDKLQGELREFNSLREASALTSISPTKVLIDAFMEMLHHFRLPFIVAPFEAEAQCAAISGIDGIISDDSDCLLFGAEVIFKGFFGKNMQSGVSMISISRIRQHIGLNRNDLIVLAHLLGCDYCTGIEGIGPKRALELVRQVTSNDPVDSLHKIVELSQDTGKKYHNWLKNKIPNNFTDTRVIQAFLNPIVAPLKAEDMKWGSFDQANLERFMLINAKWNREKTVKYLKDIEKKNK